MKTVCLIKLGGSFITDKNKPYTANIENIRRIAQELKKIQAPLVIAHGSGSFGHTSAKKYGGKKGYNNLWGIAKVARDAMEINRIVMDIFIEEGLPAISLRPMSMFITKNGKTTDHFLQVVEEVLSQELIPVLYGDVVFDRRWKSTILSSEILLNLIAFYLKKKGFTIHKIIQVGKTDGIYDASGNTVPIITKKSWTTIKSYIHKHPAIPDVTGGMKHKVEQALTMTKYNIKTWVINGNIPNQVIRILNNHSVKGTLIQK